MDPNAVIEANPVLLSETLARVNTAASLADFEALGLELPVIAPAVFDWAGARKASKVVTKALGRVLQATTQVDGVEVSRFAQGVEMLSYAAACAPLLDSDRLARLIELAPSTEMAYQPIQDVVKVSEQLQKTLARFPQERRERLLKDLWVTNHVVEFQAPVVFQPLDEDRRAAQATQRPVPSLDYYQQRIVDFARRHWSEENGFSRVDIELVQGDRRKGYYGGRDRSMSSRHSSQLIEILNGVALGEDTGQFEKGTGKKFFETLREKAKDLPVVEDFLATARKDRNYRLDGFNSILALLQLDMGMEQGAVTLEAFNDLDDLDVRRGYREMQDFSNRRAGRIKVQLVLNLVHALTEGLVAHLKPETIRLLAGHGAFLEVLVQQAPRAIAARPEVRKVLSEFVTKDHSVTVHEVVNSSTEQFTEMMRNSSLVYQVQNLGDKRVTSALRKEILNRVESSWMDLTSGRTQILSALCQEAEPMKTLIRRLVRKVYPTIPMAERVEFLRELPALAVEAVVGLEKDTTLLMEAWGQWGYRRTDNPALLAAWLRLLTPAARTWQGSGQVLGILVQNIQYLPRIKEKDLLAALDIRAGERNWMGNLTQQAAYHQLPLSESVWDKAIRSGDVNLGVKGNRGLQRIIQGRYTLEELSKLRSQAMDLVKVFHPGLVPLERPESTIVTQVNAAHTIVEAELTAHVPARAAEWKQLIPSEDVIPYLWHTSAIKSLDGMTLEGLGVELRLLKSPMELKENGEHMGNCTYSYYSRQAQAGSMVFVHFTHQQREFNASFQCHNSQTQLGEVNSRFNRGNVPNEVYSALKGVAKTLSS